MRNKLLILTIPIFSILFTEGVLSQTTSLTTILEKYCVPPTQDICSSGLLAKYNMSTESCDCQNSEYMIYNIKERKCMVECPAGSIPEIVNECPGGFETFVLVK